MSDVKLVFKKRLLLTVYCIFQLFNATTTQKLHVIYHIMIRTLASFAIALGLASASGPVSLTKDNFDEVTAGKNAFVKFLGRLKFIFLRT